MVRALLIVSNSAAFESLFPTDSMKTNNVLPLRSLRTPHIPQSRFSPKSPVHIEFQNPSLRRRPIDRGSWLLRVSFHATFPWWQKIVGFKVLDFFVRKDPNAMPPFGFLKKLTNLNGLSFKDSWIPLLPNSPRDGSWDSVLRAILLLVLKLGRDHDPNSPSKEYAKPYYTSIRLTKLVKQFQETRHVTKR